MICIVQNDPRVPFGVYGEFLRGKGIASRHLRPFAGEPLPHLREVAALVVLGGTMGAGEEAETPFLGPLRSYLRTAAETGLPLIGICLGGQLLAAALGAEVATGTRGEQGMQEVHLTAAGQKDPLFAGFPERFRAFQWHNDSFAVPGQTLHLAASERCPGQVFRYRNAYALQFHPEVNAEIVTAWNRQTEPGRDHVAGYVREAPAWRVLALRLFGNFLRHFQLG